MLEAERRFRRITPAEEAATLATAVEREVAQTATPSPTQEAATLVTA